MKEQVSKSTGQHSVDPVFLFQPPVESDYPLLSTEKEAIARQASVARGWLFALREVTP